MFGELVRRVVEGVMALVRPRPRPPVAPPLAPPEDAFLGPYRTPGQLPDEDGWDWDGNLRELRCHRCKILLGWTETFNVPASIEDRHIFCSAHAPPSPSRKLVPAPTRSPKPVFE